MRWERNVSSIKSSVKAVGSINVRGDLLLKLNTAGEKRLPLRVVLSAVRHGESR